MDTQDANIKEKTPPPDLAPDTLPESVPEGKAVTKNSEPMKTQPGSLDDYGDHKLCISELYIECTSEEIKDISLKLIQIEYKDIENNGLFALEEISPTTWKMNSLVVLPLSINQLVFTAYLESHYDAGQIQLEEDDLGDFRHNRELKRRFEQIKMASTAMTMKLSFTLSTEDYGQQVPISSDPYEISPLQQMVQLIPTGHSELPMWLNNLGTSIQARFERYGDLDDVSQAIASLQRSVQLTSGDHPELPGRLNNLGISFRTRFEALGDVTDILEAIALQQRALQITPKAHADLPGRLNDLGNSFHTRFHHFGDVADITESIVLHQSAVDLTPEGHPDLAMELNSLGVSFLTKFERLGEVADLSQAITSLQKAILITPKSHPDLPIWLNNLGNSFCTRFQGFGDVDDISEAIKSLQKAVQLTPVDHPDLPAWLNNLGNIFCTHYKCFGNADSISGAITSLRRAIQLTHEGHLSLATRLNSLGISLRTRFEHSGNLIDISEAITSHQRAVQLISEDHPDLPVHLNSLGVSLQTRFERFGDEVDISSAISTLQRAIEITPEGHPALPGKLSNLGNSFLTSFEHFGDVAHISEAIALLERAVQLTQNGHPDITIWLNNLGISYRTRFDCLGDVHDISGSIKTLQRAIQLTPIEHPGLPASLNNLGNSLNTRFKHCRDDVDISEIISSHEKAIRLTPEGHPSLPSQLNNLGVFFHTLFEHFGDPEHLITAISHFRSAAIAKSGFPSQRLAAAKNWAKCSQGHNPPQTLEAYTLTIDLMSEVAGMEQTVELRHTNLTQMSKLASLAVSAAFSQGRLDLALEWLEQGRCLVWNQLNQLRTPSRELNTKYPDLAEKFQQLSKILAEAGSRQGLSVYSIEREDILRRRVALEDAANSHIKAATEYNQLLEKIRAIPEFHNFLRPRTASEILKNLPENGYVILINIHEDRCDALALVSDRDQPFHIPLERFTSKQAEGLRSQLSNYLSRHGLQMRDIDRGIRPVQVVKYAKIILRTLWLAVVKPIFDALGFKTPYSAPRRIWWCATGPLAFLPIHAAGDYGEGGDCVSDFAVSSYIPTVSILIDKIQDMAEENNITGRLLLVSQAAPNPLKTKDSGEARTMVLTKIPGVDKENVILKNLMKVANIEALSLMGNSATISNVQKEMVNYESIHLACHGKQDFRKPLHSGFYLLDGPLQLSEIMKRHNPRADLAFLSACETSTGDEKLAEEAVHLAAGMLAAGYRSVVGTMWSIQDNYGPEVAEDFYSELLKIGEEEGKRCLDGRSAAYAIQYATQRLRKKVGDNDSGLLTWLPYVHFGI